MKKTRLVLGGLLLGLGAVWTFQGYGTLKGSFMTGSPVWMWIGIACVVAGAVVLSTGASHSRRRRSSPPEGPSPPSAPPSPSAEDPPASRPG
jgi:hypothetical protein